MVNSADHIPETLNSLLKQESRLNVSNGTDLGRKVQDGGNDKLKRISDNSLIEAYNYAIKLELSPDFIERFEIEIKKRGLEEQIVTLIENKSV